MAAAAHAAIAVSHGETAQKNQWGAAAPADGRKHSAILVHLRRATVVPCVAVMGRVEVDTSRRESDPACDDLTNGVLQVSAWL